jgi:phospholipid/cholesterol/gamma-HCH transport system substrate-binding protein
VRKLDDANRALAPFAKGATPEVRDEIRPFVREARPVVRELRPGARALADATPDLTRSFTVLNHLFNMVGFNKDGREGPDKADRDEGYLFWIAWLNHNASALFSSSDAHGAFRPITLGATCSVAQQMITEEDPSGQLAMVLGPLLLDDNLCGDGK